MDRPRIARLTGIIIAALFFVPPLPVPEAEAGSVWSTGGPSFNNGTASNLNVSSLGIRLPCNDTYQNTWTRMDPWPAPRTQNAMAYDSANGVAVLFGGMDSRGYVKNDTWLYNLTTNTWTERHPNPTPMAQAGHSMAFDSANGVVVLFGSDPIHQSATWTYNVSSDKWTNQRPDPKPAFWYNRIVYDRRDGVMVSLGDYSVNNTWIYNLTDNSWTKKNPTAAPSIRYNYDLAFDDASGCAVLFGGVDYLGYQLLNETWIYDISANTWTEKHPNPSPAAQTHHAMAYDSSSGSVVLLGRDNSQFPVTWTYNVSADRWTNRNPQTLPPYRASPAIVYDCIDGKIILFGGNTNPNRFDDTWTYQTATNNWVRMTPNPDMVDNRAMAFDSANGLAVQFGGVYSYYSASRGLVGDTYTYDLRARAWKNMQPSKAPSARERHAMAYDSAEGVMVLFGGFDGNFKDDTWTYNFSANIWKRMTPAYAPSPRASAVMIYDSLNDLIVLFGGSDYSYLSNETWIYDVSADTWTQRFPDPAPPMLQSQQSETMVFDSLNGIAVLFTGRESGYGTINETWTYNAATNKWTNRTTPNAPSGRSGFALAFDKALGVTILYGGWDSGAISDTWTYDAGKNSWKKLNPDNSPGRRAGHLMVYDSVNDAVIFVGGAYDLSAYDVWAYDLKQFLSPGNYTSPSFDAGGSVYFGNITWKADVPANTSLKFQFRTANSSLVLDQTQFTGPDGTNATFYDSSGQDIAKINNGTRWMQYRAYLSTSDPAFTPLLKNVTINCNLLHDLTLLSPAGGENWTGVQNITWSASDPDGDGLFVDIELLDPDGTRLGELAYGLPADDFGWEWDTSPVANGDYRIRLTCRDDNESIPLSVNRTLGTFTIFHPHINEAPSAELVYPENGAVITTDVVNLTWTGSDPENDTIDYTVYVLGESFDVYSLPAEGNVTYDTFYELTGLADLRTYWWTVVPCDGQLPGEAPEVRNFTVDLPHAPVVELLSPADNARLNSSQVELKWAGSDADDDSLFYLVYFNSTPFDASSLPALTINMTTTSHIATGLANGTTYYWTVVPGDLTLTGGAAPVRSFTIDLSIGNRLPRFTSTAPLNATVDELYEYNLTAVDDDGDPMTFSKVAGPANLTVNWTTGKVTWRPNATGNFTATIRVTDAKEGYTDQTFTIAVRARPPVQMPPTCTVVSQINNTDVKGTVTVQGTASAGSRPVTLVQFRVDDGPWQDTAGTTSWSFTLDTTTLENGRHTVAVRACDGQLNSTETLLNLNVQNPAPSAGAAFPMWVLIVVVLVAVACGAAFLASRKKRAGVPPETPEPALPAEEETATAAEAAASGAAAAGTGDEEAAPGKTLTSAEVEEAAAPAAALSARPAPLPPIPVPAKTAPAGFAVEDIFLMYEDGRLIQHTTRRIKADMDVDIMTSMLKAVQDFVKESIGQDSAAELGSMEYGGSKILLEKGKRVILAVVIEGAEPEGFRDEMKAVVRDIEAEFATVLQLWDGMTKKLADVKRFLSRLGEYSPPERKAAAEGAKTDVLLKAELEFYQGFVRLKVAARNNMETLVADASFKLIYKDAVLRLDHVEPDYPLRGDDVLLGNIEPKEKKTVAFYLDPQICTESSVEGVLTFKDHRGNLEMAKMPRKTASVICPIVYTDENINTAMLKRLAVEELDKKDTKVFQIPAGIGAEKAFEMAKSAVQHHDVRSVREFVEKAPFIGEAWYYGKAKGREGKLVIRARVVGEKSLLEFYVASDSTLMLTGMLAELKTDLNREMDAQKVRLPIRQVTKPEEVDALATIRTLLDKASELELGVGETEMKN